MKTAPRHIHARKQRGAANIAEFAPALFIFFLIILFPMLDLLGLVTGAATVALLSRQAAARAASAVNYDEACSNVEQEANNMVNSGFGRFAKLVPQGGSNGCGTDLYVLRTEITSNVTTSCGPNKSCPPPVDTAKYIYEYSTHSKYACGPFVNLSAMPGIGSIPGIGQPAIINMTFNMAVENPQGLVGTSGLGGSRPVGTFN